MCLIFLIFLGVTVDAGMKKKIECLLWEATELINYIVLPWHEDTKVCINCPSYVIKITTITIFSRHSYFLFLGMRAKRFTQIA